MTEEEAKTKWCPMVRSATMITGVDFNRTAVGGAGCNRAYENDTFDACRCIGSECMMWVPEGTGPDPSEYPGGCGLVVHLQPFRTYTREG